MFEEQYRRDNDRLHADPSLLLEIQRQAKRGAKGSAGAVARAKFVRYGAVAAAFLLVLGGSLGALVGNTLATKNAEAAPMMMMASSGDVNGEMFDAATGFDALPEASIENSAVLFASPSAAIGGEDGDTVASYDELYERILGMESFQYKTRDVGLAETDSAPKPAATAAPTATAAAEDGAGGMGACSDYSTTNVQVAGVDEADIVKTDGKYLYYLTNDHLIVASAAGVATKILSTTMYMTGEDWYGYASEMFLLNNRLIIITQGWNTVWTGGANGYHDGTRTISIVYDVSDPENPRKITTLGQSGSYVSSRMVDGFVYVVTTHDVVQPRQGVPASFAPELAVDGVARTMAVSDLSVYPGAKSPVYTVVSAFDLTRGTAHESARAALGGAGTIYANQGHLLIAVSDYTRDVSEIAPDADGRNVQVTKTASKTRLMLYTIDKGNIERVARGTVEGTLLNQFAMDEFEGAFRIVTTVNNWEQRIYTDGVDTYEYDDRTYNCLYTLDGNLQPLGSLEELAENEWVESVRFDGNIAYFVTFRQTDPLFTVDLSDPKAPKLLGALKIPGFSEYLHLFGKDRLFGIGYDADEKTGWREGVKLTMFDTSDKADVTELSTLRIEAGYTMVGENHKAILIDKAKNLIAFPADQKYYVFGYDEGKGFVQKAVVGLDDDVWSYAMRGVLVGEHLYVLSGRAIVVLSLADFTRVAKAVVAFG